MITNLSDLINLSKSFFLPDEILKAKEEGRLSFINKFPKNQIINLSLNEYAIGTNEDSFCYWLEFKKILFGIGGGNASKFGIYRSDDGEFYKGARAQKIKLEGTELTKEFNQIKQNIVTGLDLIEKNRFYELAKIKSSVWNMVLLKIYCIYYPNFFLTIGSPKVIIECAKILGITESDLKSENSILLNYLCRKKLNETKEFSNWEYEKIGTFIWKTINENQEDTFFNELKKFLDQSKTDNLRTSSYKKKYMDLKVKVGFGKGNQARITWIAFLREKQQMQEGIYPVFLYYKNKNKLILAYGVSETKKPLTNWNLLNPKSIQQYFLENNLDVPERYGNSFIYNVYDTANPLNRDEIDGDLLNIINEYKKITLDAENKIINKQKENFNKDYFYNKSIESKFFISYELSIRYISSLITKPFVILTGLSGSGKTKLAQAFAMWICEDESQYRIIPVGADWTNREPLLGFPDALDKAHYILPETGVLNLIIEASKPENSSKPYFLILDEMNLSHVERYFADFLSVMESKTDEGILLHSDIERRDSNDNLIPNNVKLAPNLFIVGTVNIDETTYMFSPKVLDRANVIEFSVTEEEMLNYLQNLEQLNLKNLIEKGANMASHFVELANDKSMKAETENNYQSSLLRFFDELKKTGAEFGYRTASEIMRFIAVIDKLRVSWNEDQILDAAIMQKLLPKVHGSRRKLSPILETLATFCLKENLKENKNIKDYLIPADGKTEIPELKYPVSFEKISRMYKNLVNNGFTSYAEA